MSKVIAVASQKGGVSKSTTCRNVATILAKEGFKVLAIDCDNQASLTDCFGIEKPDKLETTLYHLMMHVMNEKDLPPKGSYTIESDVLECKCRTGSGKTYLAKVLIYPYWNVNTTQHSRLYI